MAETATAVEQQFIYGMFDGCCLLVVVDSVSGLSGTLVQDRSQDKQHGKISRGLWLEDARSL
jgi:hypothetical protein